MFKEVMRILKVRMPRKNLHSRLEELESSRQDQYGSFEDNMNKIAASWSIILDKHLIEPIQGWQVPLLYAQAKLIRATKIKLNTITNHSSFKLLSLLLSD
jgi:hypothetical protein